MARMNIMTLSDNVKIGQKIRTCNGWRKILEINETGVLVKEGQVSFGHTILGWKIK